MKKDVVEAVFYVSTYDLISIGRYYLDYKFIVLVCYCCFLQQKCLQYWPEQGEQMFGHTHVSLVKTEDYTDHVVRHLQIKQVLFN